MPTIIHSLLPVGYEDRNLLLTGWRIHAAKVSRPACVFRPKLWHALAPKQITTPEFTGLANYAYHLDAGKFGPFLRKHCIDKLGVDTL